MRLADHLDEVFGAFRKQRLRTALTATGIGIGAFAITLMVGLGQGLQTYIEEQFLAFDNDRVLMVFPDTKIGERLFDRLAGLAKPAERMREEDESERRMRRAGVWITPEQVDRVRALPGVEAIEPMTWLEVDGIQLVGATPAQEGRYETDFAALSTSPLVGQPSYGRLPQDDAAELMLSPQYAMSWGVRPEELLGRQVRVRVPYLGNIMQRFMFRDPTAYEDKHELFEATIVGLTEKSPLSRGVYGSQSLGRAMIRFQSGNQTLLSDQKIGFQAHVRLSADADSDAVKAAIKGQGLMARSIRDQLVDIRRVFLLVDVVLTSFGGLALLVATLGIANTLLMAITERTREIGVMKALGMTEATIRRMFALEAAAIGLAGGLGGMLLALGLGLGGNVAVRLFVPAAVQVEGYSVFYFPWWLLLGTPLFASVIGGLAGIYPANRAARLDPIQALHHD